MDLDVVFLGTAGSMPTASRGLPATLIRRGGDRILVDCGEGTQRQLLRSVGLLDLEHVFITHYHADHVLGLPGLLKSYGLRGRDVPLAVHGPPGLRRLFETLAPMLGRLPFELRLVELNAGDEVGFEGFSAISFRVNHRVSGMGYAFVEQARPGRFNETRARELGVAPGPDFGRLQRGEPVEGRSGRVRPEQVLGEERRGRKVVITGDTAPWETTKLAAHEADLLVHEATFGLEDAARAYETGHSTARGAAEIARDADVALLALYHLSPRYPGPDLRDEAREAFPSTVVPRDFDRIEIPFPERGSPELVRPERRRPASDPAEVASPAA